MNGHLPRLVDTKSHVSVPSRIIEFFINILKIQGHVSNFYAQDIEPAYLDYTSHGWKRKARGSKGM